MKKEFKQFEKNTQLIATASKWKDICFLKQGSLLVEDLKLWTHENFDVLRSRVISNDDKGSASFEEKLKQQLSGVSSDAICLWAEITWLFYLIVGSVTKEYKFSRIQTVWSWSERPFPSESWALAEALEHGNISPGQGFLGNQWFELKYLIELMFNWTNYSDSDQNEKLSDPWNFAKWLDSQTGSDKRMLRHAILHFLFPNHFFDGVSQNHKRRMVETFRNSTEQTVDIWRADLSEVDYLLHEISLRLQKEHRADYINFYLDPFKKIWDGTEDEEWLKHRFQNATVWIVAPGHGAQFWQDFTESGFVRLGYHEEVGDLNLYDTQNEINDRLRDLGVGNNPVMSSLALWQFRHQMKPGDILIAKQGIGRLLGWGRVTGEYCYDPENRAGPHVRNASWHLVLDQPIQHPSRITSKTLTHASRPVWSKWLRQAFNLMEDDTPNGNDDFLKDIFVLPKQLNRIQQALASRKNLILQGPPGVGKTFIAQRIAYCLIGKKDSSQIKMVQFHQSYSYEDFVQGWRPTKDGGFVLRDGVFLKFCQLAAQHPQKKFVFIIDEINRGNLSRIFGELLMLIEADKRGSDYSLALTHGNPDDLFSIPENVYILGLMNTADRSLAIVDYALRRRFAFETLSPAFQTDRFRDYLNDSVLDDSLVEHINKKFAQLNHEICNDKDLGEGFQIGHSYFVPEEDADEAWYSNVLDTQIAPLLQEYWFDRPEKVKEEIDKLKL